MACELIIQSAVGQGQPGSPLASLKVSGNAAGCTSVSITVLCVGQNPVQHAGVPVVGGQWETTFTAQELKVAGCLECGSSSYPLTVRARCDDGLGECSDFREWPTGIPCEAAPADCCPTVSFVVTEGDCDADGRRAVTIQVTTTPATGPDCAPTVFAQLDFGDGALGAAFTVPPDGVWQETHAYQPGSYTAALHVIVPAGCPDVTVKVGPLEACPPGCPDADDITVGVSDYCDAQGRRIVSLTVLLPGVGPTTGTVDWTDGTVTGPAPLQGGTPWTVTHPYTPPGAYKAIVTIEGCPPITKPIGPLEPCGRGDGDGGDGRPCPWWNPFCKGWSLCAGLLAGALTAMLLAAVLALVGACTGNVVVIVIAAIAAIVALAALSAWFGLCSSIDPDFCATLDQLIQLFTWIVAGQAIVILLLALLALMLGFPLPLGCSVGAAAVWGYYGTVLAYLLLIKDWTNCP
ncbi:MAG: hypothetical protein ACRDFY_02510 [Candidatus Limnocylindria bacterium]